LRAFSEIEESADTLEVIATLARRAPPKGVAVRPEAQLRLFVEAYLQEIYILSLRCAAMLTFIKRAYRKDARADAVAARVTTLKDGIAASFKGMLSVRGAHVHEFRHDDFDVSRLSTLKLLAADPLLERVHRAALRDVRRKKTEWMRTNNEKIGELLDRFFTILHELVFDAASKPRFPSPLRSA